MHWLPSVLSLSPSFGPGFSTMVTDITLVHGTGTRATAPMKRAREPSEAQLTLQASAKLRLACDRAKSSASLFETSALCDGIVELNGRAFPVSCMMVAAASPFFKAAFTGVMREATERRIVLDPSLSAASVEALLRFAHSLGPLIVQESELENLIVAADQLGLTEAIPMAAAQLGECLQPDNFAQMLQLAERYSLHPLVHACVKLCNQNFAMISSVLTTLPASSLALLLRHDALRVQERDAKSNNGGVNPPTQPAG